MIFGVEITNFDVFDCDKAGLLIEESIEARRAGDKSKNKLRNLNALIGRNDTGKTSFMQCLSFLKDCVTTNVADASIKGERQGFSNMVPDKDNPAIFKVFFKLKDKKTNLPKYIQYELELAAGKFGSPYVKSERVLLSERFDNEETQKPDFRVKTILDMNEGAGTIVFDTSSENGKGETQVEDEHLTALSVYGRLSAYRDLCDLFGEISDWFFCRFSSSGISNDYIDGKAPGGHKHLNSTGSNVSNVLEYMKQTDEEEFERIVTEIKNSIPNMKKKKNLPKDLSDSPNKLFLYLLLLRDKRPHSTIFIETPDKDLYHDMVDVLADEMRDFGMRNRYCQIIFSTHNPYIIENMSPKEIWVFSRTFDEENGDITIRCAGDNPLVNEMFAQGVGMGAIWYAGHLDSGDIDYAD